MKNIVNNPPFFFADLFINIKNKKDLIAKVNQALGKKIQITVSYLNVGSYYYLISLPKYKELMLKTEYCYLNSYYLKRLFSWLGFSADKINAEDFIYDLFDFCQRRNRKIFLLGSEKKTLKKALANIKSRNKTLLINGYNGFFKENSEPIRVINDFFPDVLIIGLGSGHQETWLMKNLPKLKNIKVIITVGNFIDVLGGQRKIIPDWIKKVEMEWLYRLLHEPLRLWQRYFIGSIVVIYTFILSLRRKRLQNYSHR